MDLKKRQVAKSSLNILHNLKISTFLTGNIAQEIYKLVFIPIYNIRFCALYTMYFKSNHTGNERRNINDILINAKISLSQNFKYFYFIIYISSC